MGSSSLYFWDLFHREQVSPVFGGYVTPPLQLSLATPSPLSAHAIHGRSGPREWATVPLSEAKVAGAAIHLQGLWLSAACCEPGEVYNLGGDRIYSVQEVIECIRRQLKVAWSVQQHSELQRGCDEKVIAGDIGKFRLRTGWTAQIELKDTLQDMLDWWRVRMSQTSELTQATPNV